ncbi:helix-turn-helix domain-containing protein [Streptomyces griseoaurantiacus]|uniref:helix-turn-helix domain-containing protein n=1 Tax=Streptomyces griseoaurantiacus TaxID=68213 RepID=UPI0037F2BA9A
MARYPNPLAAIRAAWLISRARQGSDDLGQTELGEGLGFGQAAVSKYEGGLREPTFADLQRLIAHTDYRLEVRLRPEPRQASGAHHFHVSDPMPFAVSDLHLSRRMPAQLNPEAGRLPSSDRDGPLLEEALLYLYELQALAADLRRPEERLQRAYEQFHTERDRDLIHQMLALGAGASQAARILARAIDHGTDRPAGRRAARREHNDPRASRLVWAHIVCSLRAEEGICRERISWLRRALDAARLRRRAQIRVEDAELIARNSERPGALADVDQAKAELEAVSRACADHSHNGGAEDVGLAGERYLIAELAELADRARALYDELASEPAFATWRAEHAATDPLYDAWLDGELRDFPSPPRLYPDWEALAKDRTSISESETGDGGRTVADHFGQQWKIHLVASTDTASAAVARLISGDQATGPLYLLADHVDTAQATESIASGPASLTAVTMALLSA